MSDGLSRLPEPMSGRQLDERWLVAMVALLKDEALCAQALLAAALAEPPGGLLAADIAALHGLMQVLGAAHGAASLMMPSDDALQSDAGCLAAAGFWFERGQYSRASSLFDRVVAANGPARALAALGQARIAQRQGRHAQARYLLRQALHPDGVLSAHPVLHQALVRSSLALGDVTAAWSALSLAETGSAAAGGDPAMWRLLRIECLLQRGDAAEALTAARSLAAEAMAAVPVRAALLALVRLGRCDELWAWWAEAGNRLAPAEMRRLDDSMPALLASQGYVRDAVGLLRGSLAAAPDDADVYARLAWLAMQHALPEVDAAGAVAQALAVIETLGEEPRALACCAQAELWRRGGDAARAEACLRAAIAQAPLQPAPRWALGQYLLRQRGGAAVAAAAATETVAEAVAMISEATESAWRQAMPLPCGATPLTGDPRRWALIESAAQRSGLAAAVAAGLEWAVAGALKRSGQPGRAHALAEQAHRRVSPQLGYRPLAHRAQVDDILASFTPARLAAWQGWGLQTQVPVFVLGMPDAGQVQVTALLAALAGVHDAGELGLLPCQLGTLALQDRSFGRFQPYPACLDELTADDVHRIATRRLADLQLKAPHALRIIDRQPDHVEALGFIKLLYPQARLVWCVREPRDQGRALYWGAERAGNARQAYRHDLRWIGAQWVDHSRLMNHWRALYGDDLLVVPYESLQQDMAAWADRLATHVGLPGGAGGPARLMETGPVIATVEPARFGAAAALAPLDEALACVPPKPLPRPLPELPPGLLHQSMTRLQCGDAHGAEQGFKHLLDVDPDHAAAWQGLGMALQRRAQPMAAWTALRQALQLWPGRLDWWHQLFRAQQTLVEAGLDRAGLMLASDQSEAGTSLLRGLVALAAATVADRVAGGGAPPAQPVFLRVTTALLAGDVVAWPVLDTLADLLTLGRLADHRRQVFLQVPAGQLEAACGRLHRLGLVLVMVADDGSRLMTWPSMGFGLILRADGDADVAAQAQAHVQQIGDLQFRVPVSAQLRCTRVDLAVHGAAWRVLETLQLWLAGSPEALQAQLADWHARGWSITDLQPLAHAPHRPMNSDDCSAAARLTDTVVQRLVGLLA